MPKERKANDAGRFFFEENRQDWRVSLFALAMTLALHALAFLLVPANILTASPGGIDELELEILPPELETPLPPLPEYVEANPDANMQPPENETNQESFQDQTAAQENPDPDRSDSMPEMDGELEDSKKIISGDLNEQSSASAMQKVFETLDRPLERPADGESQNQSPVQIPMQNSAAAGSDYKNSPPDESGKGRDSKNASPFVDDAEAEDPAITAETFSKDEQDAAPAEELAEEEKKTLESEESEISVADMDLPKPMERRQVRTVITRTPPGPLAKNNTRANRTGVVAVDSKFSEFGAYQQRMVEAVARQWHLLASRYDLGGLYNTQVTVEFFLDPEGEITSYKTTFNTSSLTGKNLCEQAILSTAPYGPWTSEMRALFGGREQSVSFSFYYR